VVDVSKFSDSEPGREWRSLLTHSFSTPSSETALCKQTRANSHSPHAPVHPPTLSHPHQHYTVFRAQSLDCLSIQSSNRLGLSGTLLLYSTLLSADVLLTHPSSTLDA
jgi:hypothetical protein